MLLSFLLFFFFLAGHGFAKEEIIGTIAQNLRATEGNTTESLEHSTTMVSELGAAAADAARMALKTDLALLYGGNLKQNILSGDVTDRMILNAFWEESELAVAYLTPAQLYSLIEIGVSHLVISETEDLDLAASEFYAFPQISGFTVRCDASAAPGERVMEIRLSDNTLLGAGDNQTVYSIAVPYSMKDAEYGYPSQDLYPSSVTDVQALTLYIASGALDNYEQSRTRVEIIGTNAGKWMGQYSRSWLLGCSVLAMILVVGISSRRGQLFTDDTSA